MNNIIEFNDIKNGRDFTEEVPESATLERLCAYNAVRTVDIEDESGRQMIIAYFINDGWLNVYQDGCASHAKHLYFYIIASKSYDDSKGAVLRLVHNVLGDNWILSE